MKVEIYGNKRCSFCHQSITLCEVFNIAFDYIDIDTGENLRTLEERVGNKVKTIPQIFLDGQYIGGYDNLREELASKG